MVIASIVALSILLYAAGINSVVSSGDDTDCQHNDGHAEVENNG